VATRKAHSHRRDEQNVALDSPVFSTRLAWAEAIVLGHPCPDMQLFQKVIAATSLQPLVAIQPSFKTIRTKNRFVCFAANIAAEGTRAKEGDSSPFDSCQHGTQAQSDTIRMIASELALDSNP
jgi:hypothetical protein